MKIDRITFTGADTSVTPDRIMRVVDEYPHIMTEWALLLSKSTEGKRSRYPSLSWMENFIKETRSYKDKMAIAGHLQGEWLRGLCLGEDVFHKDRPTICDDFPCFQLNFHGTKTTEYENLFILLATKELQYIFQMDGVNENIYHEYQRYYEKIDTEGSSNLFPLFDLSAGAGIVPDFWPKPIHKHLNGYAGGLGPNTMKEQLKRIAEVAGDTTVWLDMETCIRSNNDRIFDLDKCRKVLDIVAA